MAEKIPLTLRMKKELHRKLALLHDLLVHEIYVFFPKAVFHGGTAIWRCYGAKRFSEDLDFYLEKNVENIENFFQEIQKRGFVLKKKRILENSIYSELEYDRTVVRFEATFQKKNGALVDYENSDGTYMHVYSLTPEEFLKEKVSTYLKRRKIRDLYDIFFLSRLVVSSQQLSLLMQDFLEHYEKPIDEQDLKTIILEGVVPKAEEMYEYLRRKWEKKNIGKD